MSYTIGTSEFTDLKNTDWKVKIVSVPDPGVGSSPFSLGPDGFSLTYDFDEYDRCKPIVGSRVQITLYHPTDTSVSNLFDAFYNALDTAEEGTYRIEIYRDPDSANELFWCGEIVPEQTVIPDDYPHAPVTLTAVDGLGNLKGILYNNSGISYTGTDLITEHLYKAISKVHSISCWSSSDILLKFYEDFIASPYKASIGSAQNQQLNNARLSHNTFHNTNNDGVNEFYSTYRVLETIAMSFNACLLFTNGSYWFIPMGAVQSHVSNNLKLYHQINGDGSVQYNTSDNLTDSVVEFGSSTNYKKLKGWQRSSVPSFKEVKRVRNYQGDRPLLFHTYYNIPRVSNSYGEGAILNDEDAQQPIDRAYNLSGNLNFFTSGISSLTGLDAVVRVRLRFRVAVGDAGGTAAYAKRNDSTYSSAATSTAVWYGETADMGYTYREPQYGAQSFTSDSSDRFTWVGQPFNGNNGGASYPLSIGSQFYHGEEFSLDLPGITAEAIGLQLSVEMDFIDWQGNAITSVDFLSQTSVVSQWKITNLGLRILENNVTVENGQVDLYARNPNDSRYLFDQGETLVGDQISVGSLGVLEVYNGSEFVQVPHWQNLQESLSTIYSINGLGVRERLGANKTAQRTERGTLVKVGSIDIHPYTILENTHDSGNFYQITGLSYIANRCEYDIQCMFVSRNITGVTGEQTNDRPTKGPRPPIGPTVGLKGPADTTIQDANSTKLGFVTTDTYGITQVTTSTGSSAIDISLPISKSGGGEELVTINSLGAMAPLADGASGEFLKTNGAGSLSWAAAGGGGGGWFGSTTLLKVMPTQWIMNDDYTRAPVVVEDDVTNVLGIKAPATSTELYAFMAIPTGYKATHVQVYTSSNKINGVEVLRFSHVSGATAARGTGDFNTSIDITDISSAVATNICIKLLPASVTTIIYGADITIATI